MLLAALCLAGQRGFYSHSISMQALKEQIRAEMRRRLADLASDERARASESILGAIPQLQAWNAASTVLLFWPRRDEPGIESLCLKGIQSGKAVVLPSYDASSETYQPRLLRAPTDLIRGRFGIEEPAPLCPIVPVEDIDFALVPGLAFDRTGVRLGRGRGFYDRLLESFRGFACGIAFRFQEYPELPSETHDRRMDHVLFG